MDYDICDSEIRCNADKIGAAVFEVQRGRRTLRILTFDLERAEEIAGNRDSEANLPEEDDTPFLF